MSDATGVEEDASNGWLESELGKTILFLLVASALFFFDYACERRLCCRLWRGKKRETREDQEKEEDNVGDLEIPELYNSGDNVSDRAEAIVVMPTETDVRAVEIQRIDSLRIKRREIEHWFEHKPKQESPLSSGNRRNDGQ